MGQSLAILEKSKEAHKVYVAKWQRTERGKEVNREAQRKYRQSAKGKEAIRKRSKKYCQIHRMECIERSRKHRQTINGHLRKCFLSLRCRCNDPGNKDYRYYGARGIKNLFKSFDEFFHHITIDLGYDTYEKIKGLQIDRINNDSHYMSSNIRFVTPKINSNNRRKKINIEAIKE